MVEVETQCAVEPGGWGGSQGFVGLVGGPFDGFAHVGHPPHARELVFGEERVPFAEELVHRVQGLMPFDVECFDSLEGDLSDDAEGAETDERGAEEVDVLLGGAGDDAAVGERNLEASDGLRHDAMPRRAAVCRGADCAGDRLLIDASQIRHCQTMLFKLCA